MAAKKIESLEADLEKYREEVKGNFAALGNKLDSEVEALRKRQELEDKRYKEVKNMLLSLTNKDTSYVRPVEPLKKVQTGLKFDDLGFPIPPTNTGTSADGGRKKISEIMGEDDNSWGDYDGFGGSNRINLDMDDGTVKEKNGVRNTIRTGNGTRANHTEGRFFNQGYDHRMRKIKMPLFDGEDAHGWIYKAERYFEVIEVDPREQLRAAILCMKDRFQPSQEGNLHEQFLSITQDGLAREYVGLFEQLAGQLRGVSEEVMEGTFIKGLKLDLRSSVRVMQPVSLGQAMKLSIMIEENKTIGGSVSNRSSLRTSVSTGNSYSNRNTGGSVTTRSQGFNKNNDATVKPNPFKRLTDAEFADKRAKGIGNEDETGDEFDEKSDEHVHLDMVEVSLNSVMGFTSSHTMKIRGIIGDEEVVVLIDSGATHNFLSKRVLKELGLLVTGGGSINVMLGNGKFEKSRGICKGVLITFQELQILEDFYPLDLGSTYVGMATGRVQGGF
ncbi:ankyrin repeat-containing protein [Tanacetum coccineum]